MVSQPRPAVVEKSPFYELSQKHKAEIEYMPFIRVVGVSLKEFRSQRVEILAHTAVIFTSRTTVDSFFHICEEARITVPETMKYICQTEAVALYLQKYIVYRKRKISFADGSFTNFIELIIKHKEEKFMLALSEPPKPELPETLAKLKLQFSPVILARTVAADLNDLDIKKFDLLALYSPSDVKAILERFPAEELPEPNTDREYELPEASAISRDQRERVKRAIDALPDIYRETVMLHYYSGLDYKTIAAMQGSTEGTVKSRIFRAKERLYELLKEGEKND